MGGGISKTYSPDAVIGGDDGMVGTGDMIRRLGVHTSIAGGIHLSMERARALGCNTAQIFSHNPRGWRVSEILQEAVARFKELRAAYDINPVYVHSSYLINLASANSETREKSVRLLITEMDLADLLGVEYVVLHTGSAAQEPEEEARKKAIDALKRVAQEGEWGATLLIENTAGERGDISSRMADLAAILDGAGSPLLGGVCIDTCHAFQAGYDLTNAEGVEGMKREIDARVGMERVRLIHLNDSKRPFHSRVDRHEHIGSGMIGRKGITNVINEPAFAKIPLVLETPKESEEDDVRNLQAVRNLLRI